MVTRIESRDFFGAQAFWLLMIWGIWSQPRHKNLAMLKIINQLEVFEVIGGLQNKRDFIDKIVDGFVPSWNSVLEFILRLDLGNI